MSENFRLTQQYTESNDKNTSDPTIRDFEQVINSEKIQKVSELLETLNHPQLLRLQRITQYTLERVSNGNDEEYKKRLNQYLSEIQIKLDKVEMLNQIESVSFDDSNLFKIDEFVKTDKSQLLVSENGDYFLLAHGNMQDVKTGENTEQRHALDLGGSKEPVDTCNYVKELVDSKTVPAGSNLKIVSCLAGNMPSNDMEELASSCRDKGVIVSRAVKGTGNVLMLKQRKEQLKGEKNPVRFAISENFEKAAA